jgi:hypothetical protein
MTDIDILVVLTLLALFAYWIGYLTGRIVTLREWNNARR